MSWLPADLFYTYPYIGEYKYIWPVVAVHVFETATAKNFCGSHKWILFLISVYFNNVHLCLHVGFGTCQQFCVSFEVSPEACRLQNIVSRLCIMCCIFSAIPIYGMMKIVSCLCRFLCLSVLMHIARHKDWIL